MAIFPFIFLKHKNLQSNGVFINHERIHLRQQMELFVLPFFVLYGIEFVIRLILLRNWAKAYKRISFEREAYANEGNFGYLRSRSFWAFVKYL